MRRLIIDVETTGLSSEHNQILTVGMLTIEMKKRGYKVIDSEHLRIKHKEYNVNPIALKINKINLKEHHKIGINPGLACKRINRFISSHDLKKFPLVGHNLRFDLRFLNSLFNQAERKKTFTSGFSDFVDTMAIWRNLKANGAVPSHLSGSLKTVAGYFDVNYENAHDALNDCHITAEVYNNIVKMLKKIENT